MYPILVSLILVKMQKAMIPSTLNSEQMILSLFSIDSSHQSIYFDCLFIDSSSILTMTVNFLFLLIICSELLEIN
jgi:hypothetical protein